MAHRKYDGVQQLATGTGTGALTLGAATQAYYRTMQAAGAGNGDTLTCRIQHETLPAEWEEVLVTYSAGTITRTFDPNAKSATGALIAFSAGNKIVTNVLRAGDAVVMDNNGDATITRNLTVGGWVKYPGAMHRLFDVTVNMNTTADQAIDWNIPDGVTELVIQRIIAATPSISLTTAVGGMYSASAKGGIQIIGAAQAWAALTATGPNAAGSQIGITPITSLLRPALFPTVANRSYFSLTTPQGAPATMRLIALAQLI